MIHRRFALFRALLTASLVLLPGELPAIHVVEPDQETPLSLTVRERAWLEDHPIIRVGNDPSWAPIDFDNAEGMPTGLAADMLNLLAERLDLNIEYEPGQTWNEAYDGVRRHKLDMLLAVGRNPERERMFAFTRPYLKYRSVIVVRDDMPFIPDITALLKRRFALVRDYNETETLLKRYPALDVLSVATTEESLDAVAVGRADAAVGNIAVLHYKIQQLGLTNLKVAAPIDDVEKQVYFAVRNDWPELAGILDKGLAAINSEERERITSRWFNVEFERGIDPAEVGRTAARILAAVAVVALLVLFYLRRLRREIAKRRRLQSKLAEARQRLLDMTQGLPGVVYQSCIRRDGSGDILFGHEAYYRLLGIHRDSSVLDWATLSSAVYEEDRPGLRDALIKAVKEVESF